MPYRWNEVDGTARVEIWENDDPAAYGCAEFARGFPCCRATLEPAGKGYADMLGWVQMVNSTYLAPGVVADGFEPLGRLPHPFGFYGISPIFFDAPHADLEEADFRAQTFLCGLGGELLEQTEGGRREARAVLGFGWGFSKRGDRIDAFGPEPLSVDDWNSHLPYLRERFSEGDWDFLPGFFDRSLP